MLGGSKKALLGEYCFFIPAEMDALRKVQEYIKKKKQKELELEELCGGRDSRCPARGGKVAGYWCCWIMICVIMRFALSFSQTRFVLQNCSQLGGRIRHLKGPDDSRLPLLLIYSV